MIRIRLLHLKMKITYVYGHTTILYKCMRYYDYSCICECIMKFSCKFFMQENYSLKRVE